MNIKQGYTYKGNKEFRIFNKLKCENDEEYVKLYLDTFMKHRYPEQRTDFYFFPLYKENMDSIADYGLKFRNVKIRKNNCDNQEFYSNLIELKTRDGITQDGTEYWNKIISKSITKLIIMEESIVGPENNFYININDKTFCLYYNQILDVIISILTDSRLYDKTYVEQLKDGPLGLSIVNKCRISSMGAEETYIKVLNFELSSSQKIIDPKIFYFKSFSIEGYISNNEINHILEENKECVIGGYPKTLLNTFFN